jgi:signal transduction histidine kinase
MPSRPSAAASNATCTTASSNASVSLTLQLGLAKLDLPPGSPAAQRLATAHDQAKQLITELRELIHDLLLQILTDLGLPPRSVNSPTNHPDPGQVDPRLPAKRPSQVENTAYFVAAEAFTNLAKHSRRHWCQHDRTPA